MSPPKGKGPSGGGDGAGRKTQVGTQLILWTSRATRGTAKETTLANQAPACRGNIPKNVGKRALNLRRIIK